MAFLVDTFLGSFRWETLLSTWTGQFGNSIPKRFVVAFGGGIISMFGARMAGGCNSGHGISGSLQLAVSSWVFFLTMFVFVTATALLLFRKRGLK